MLRTTRRQRFPKGRYIPLLVALTLSTACSSTSGQFVGKNAQGQEVLTGTCMPGQSAKDCQAMQTVTITNASGDEEFWQFEARVQVRALVGIPYGRMPQDYNVIGTQARCEEVRAEATKMQTPTEACKGPFYFRRN